MLLRERASSADRLPIGTSDDVNLSGLVTAHEQTALLIPCQADGSKAIIIVACRDISVDHDVDRGCCARARLDGSTVFEFYDAEFVA